MKKMENVKVLNEGNPMELGTCDTGYLFTVSPSTVKKGTGYYTNSQVVLTKYELKMPGVVIAQNRGMLFSSARKISGDYEIPELSKINVIIVGESSRKLKPVDDGENKISWKGEGEHVVKDVVADGQGQHWFCHKDGRFADDLWLKLAMFGYGLKGMLQPGLASDVGAVVIDYWGVARKITMGNTIVINSSLVKGISAYNSLEELIAHSEQWGLTTLLKQWQSGDHKPAGRRIMGTQPNATNLQQTKEEIVEFLKPEARKIWATQFPEIAYRMAANIRTSRGRAIAARPSLMYNKLVMSQLDSKAGNDFLRLAQGKFMAKGEYLKMYQDKLAYSLVYVHGMDINEAAKKATEIGLHGEIRVNPSFAGMHYKKDEDGNRTLCFSEETGVDEKGRYIETALVRYPHGAPSETIIVKVYLDPTVPKDVIVFPLPVANDDGTIPVGKLYAMRLQGADFDGDAVTAFKERAWIAAQKRNTGKPYMVIPVNTESTEKDKTLVTDQTFADFCKGKYEGLSNRVGLIATSLKYFYSQCAIALQEGVDIETIIRVIIDHACAMGDDIDEFKHGKAKNDLVPFEVVWSDGSHGILYGPYFNRYAKKYRSKEDFDKAVYNKKGGEKKPGRGILDTYAVAMEELMRKSNLPIVKEVEKASDGTDRYFMTVHPVQWESRETELHIGDGVGASQTALPAELEKLYGVKAGTLFTAKSLFQLIYRNHAATCKQLMDGQDRDQVIKVLTRINERYALAKITVVAWTKAMMAKKGVEVDAAEALKLFTTMMVQHPTKSRNIIGTLIETGTFTRADGSPYEKTIFAARRWLNYFLDICGDGLLLIGTETPDFPEVSEKILKVAGKERPDLDKATEYAMRELDLIDKLVAELDNGVEAMIEDIDSHYVIPDPDEGMGSWEDMEEPPALTDEELERMAPDFDNETEVVFA